MHTHEVEKIFFPIWLVIQEKININLRAKHRLKSTIQKSERKCRTVYSQIDEK